MGTKEQITFGFLRDETEENAERERAEDEHSFGPNEDADSLEELANSASSCCRCSLREGCNGVVFGEGDPHADIMLVGEGPGVSEDKLGRPFVGKAGQLLDKILEATEFTRPEVYIGNIVKCRPPGNRLPTPEEVASCLPLLMQQIRLIRPRIIVCLGALSSQTLIEPSLRITRDRGMWRRKEGIMYMPTFHPAALLRDPSKKRLVWQDFQRIREEYDKMKA